MSNPTIKTKSLVQYSLLALPVAFAGFPLYILAPDFYATRYGLSLTLLGTLLLAIRMFDAVQDPIIGWLTDKLKGRFLPLAAASALILCLSIFGLFNLVFISPAFWFTFSMVLAVSTYSILTILLGSQATLWTTDTHDQTRISAMREAFGLFGLLTAVSIPALLTSFVNDDQIYLWYCIGLCLLMAIGLYGFSIISISLQSTRFAEKKQERPLLKDIISPPRQTQRLLWVYAISMLASSIPAVLVIFYVRDLLGAEHLTGAFLLLYFLSGALAMPVWKSLSSKVGKYKSWLISNLLAVCSFAGAFFLGSGDVVAFAVICAASGLALGADLILPPSILSDQIHEHGKQGFSGTYYAFLAFVTKASLALASAIVLPTLDAVGFKPKAVNTEKAILTLSITYALIPCILKLAAASLLYALFIRPNSGGSHENLENNSNYGSSHHA